VLERVFFKSIWILDCYRSQITGGVLRILEFFIKIL